MLQIDKTLRLELLAPKHASALFKAIESSREHLSSFLPWVASIRQESDFMNFILDCQMQMTTRTGFAYAILWNEEAVGSIGLNQINYQDLNASIGYWLTQEAQGHGLMKRACLGLIEHGFTRLNLQRLEVRAAIENQRSQAVAKSLGFQREGILRNAERVNGRFLDLYVFSLLAEEWHAAAYRV